MNNKMYFKLAKTNLIKNSKTYLPYILACICVISMFYIMECIFLNKGVYALRGAESLKRLFQFAVIVIGIFSIIFLFYTNSFLIKRRKNQIGLYNVLGMEKKHIMKVFFIETIIVAVISLILGILGGIIISKLLFLILLNLLKIDIVLTSSFSISIEAIIKTIELFIGIFMVILIFNILQVKLSSPIELIRKGKQGEKEPKAYWMLSILGLVLLIIGYGIAINIEAPLKAFNMFFIAVILVIAGTYITFVAGSIAFLKLIKKNKKIFYKSKNFILVSGMMYRMKQNATGLANICILSTAVLITVSTTSALYFGQEDSLKKEYPFDMRVSTENKIKEEKNKILDKIKEQAKNNHVIIEDLIEYKGKEGMALQKDNKFITEKENELINENDIRYLRIYTLEDYNKIEGKELSLEDNEVFVFVGNDNFNYKSIFVNEKEYKIKDKLKRLKNINNKASFDYTIIVKDLSILKDMNTDGNYKDLDKISYYFQFNLRGNNDDILEFCNSSKILNIINGGSIGNVYTSREHFYKFNGSFLFIGMFLGILFLMGTVLIIYYKQISEGYDDREKFKIMQNIGMSKEEVKKTINKQVKMVFFIPLIMSIVHICFSLKIVCKLISLFGMYSTSSLLCAVAIVVISFAIIYTIVYRLTANTYYKIIQQHY